MGIIVAFLVTGAWLGIGNWMSVEGGKDYWSPPWPLWFIGWVFVASVWVLALTTH